MIVSADGVLYYAHALQCIGVLHDIGDGLFRNIGSNRGRDIFLVRIKA